MATLEQKVIKPKLGLLELGKQLGNVSQACKIFGYSRDTYYRFKELYETGGEGALTEVDRHKPNMKNRIDPDIEKQVMEYAVEQPTFGPQRAANELKKKGVFVCPGTVRNIWLRHDCETMRKRLKMLETKVAQEGIILTESQVVALERKKEEEKAHGEIETEHPGYLLAQDTFYVGTIKGVGRIYQQTVIDTYSKVGFAKLYDRKNALTAADMLNDRVEPFFTDNDIPILRIMTDRGTEYCGVREFHEYELYLTVNEIEHTKTKARSPQTNGICERFHKTMLQEFYQIAFRKKLYKSIEELQEDVDIWMEEYNKTRPHTGKYCFGKTPRKTFDDSLHIAKEKMVERLYEKNADE